MLEGGITVDANGVAILVDRNAATLVPAGQSPVLAAREGAPARVLRVEIPPRQIVTPEIHTPRA